MIEDHEDPHCLAEASSHMRGKVPWRKAAVTASSTVQSMTTLILDTRIKHLRHPAWHTFAVRFALVRTTPQPAKVTC
jgi:hypothetical protein